jgi:hypothetical protein
MKSKLKSPDVAKTKGMVHVQKCLKTFLMEPSIDDAGKPATLKFFYHSNYEYSPSDFQPIMFVGGEIPSLWKKWMKTVKTSKEFAAGDCTLGDDMVLKLEIKLGKGGKKPILKDVYKGLLKKTAVKNAVFVDSVAGPNTEESSQDEVASTEGSFNFNEIANSIIEQFSPLENAFDSSASKEVFKKIKDWMQRYKTSEDTAKKEAKVKGAELQKIYAKVTEMIKVDKQIEKEIPEVIKGMDKFHLMNNHSNPEALDLIKQLSASLENIKGLAETINESDLISVVNDYISELNN